MKYSPCLMWGVKKDQSEGVKEDKVLTEWVLLTRI